MAPMMGAHDAPHVIFVLGKNYAFDWKDNFFSWKKIAWGASDAPEMPPPSWLALGASDAPP